MTSSCSAAVVTEKRPKPAGASSSLARSSRRMSSRSAGTSTMGAPWKRFPRAYLKPELWFPAMGWPPRKVTPRSAARGKQAAQTVRLVPQQSMTTGWEPMRPAFSRNHSMAASGLTASRMRSQSGRRSAVRGEATVPFRIAKSRTLRSRSAARTVSPASR